MQKYVSLSPQQFINSPSSLLVNGEQAHGHSASGSPHPEGLRDTESPDPSSGTSFNISNDEAIRRLRAKGQPIRLFGESDQDRRLRLRALELLEEKEHERHGGQNDFKKALEDVEINELEAKAKGKDKEKNSKNEKDDPESSGTILIAAAAPNVRSER